MKEQEWAAIARAVRSGTLGVPEFGLPVDRATYVSGDCLVAGIATGRLAESRSITNENNILLCEDCRGVPLAILSGCKAVVVRAADVTSHFVIRARHLGIPTVRVPDFNLLGRFCAGQTVTVAASPGAAVVSELPVTVTRAQSSLQEITREVRGGRTMKILANIDTSEDAKIALSLDLDGVGMWRTENCIAITFWNSTTATEAFCHVFGRGGNASAALAVASHLEHELFAIASTTWPRPVTIRLIDTPLGQMLGEDGSHDLESIRGVRLGIVRPAFLEWQLAAYFRALSAAATSVDHAGPCRFLLPFVSDVGEIKWYRQFIDGVCETYGFDHSHIQFGATIETPRAAVIIDEIAKVVDFVSFGTNDLTESMWVLNRDHLYSASPSCSGATGCSWSWTS